MILENQEFSKAFQFKMGAISVACGVLIGTGIGTVLTREPPPPPPIRRIEYITGESFYNGMYVLEDQDVKEFIPELVQSIPELQNIGINESVLFERLENSRMYINTDPYNNLAAGIAFRQYDTFVLNRHQESLSLRIHEALHLTEAQGNRDMRARMIREGVTELLVSETVGREGITAGLYNYKIEMAFVSVIADCIGIEPLLDAYFNGNYEVIKEQLEKNTDPEKVEELFEMFTEYHRAKRNVDRDRNEARSIQEIRGEVRNFRDNYIQDDFDERAIKLLTTIYLDNFDKINADLPVEVKAAKIHSFRWRVSRYITISNSNLLWCSLGNNERSWLLQQVIDNVDDGTEIVKALDLVLDLSYQANVFVDRSNNFSNIIASPNVIDVIEDGYRVGRVDVDLSEFPNFVLRERIGHGVDLDFDNPQSDCETKAR